MLFHDLRVSKEFTTFIVCVAVFSDVLLQGLIVAVLPYALRERVGLTDEVDVQRWNSLLLSAGAGTSMLGSCEYGLYDCAPLVSFCQVFWGVCRSVLFCSLLSPHKFLYVYTIHR